MKQADHDGVIRLHSKEEINAAHNDPALEQVEGWARDGKIYGGFIRKGEPAKVPALTVEPIERKRGKKHDDQ